MREKYFEYLKILAGSLLLAIGIYFFWAPAQLAGGGISGLSIVLKSFFEEIPIGVIMMGLDTIMFLLGFLVLGAHFGVKSLVSSFSISIYTVCFEQIFPNIKPLSSDTLVLLLFGSVLMALGQAVVFNLGASTGGTDIIAKIISKYTQLPIGKSLILADMTVVLLALSIFGVEKGLYAAMGVALTSLLIDYCISGLNVKKYVMIIPSDKERAQAINAYILEHLERGATVYRAEGAYSKAEKCVLTTVMDRREFVVLKQFIHQVDENAFVTVQNLHDVFGEGFHKE